MNCVKAQRFASPFFHRAFSNFINDNCWKVQLMHWACISQVKEENLTVVWVHWPYERWRQTSKYDAVIALDSGYSLLNVIAQLVRQRDEIQFDRTCWRKTAKLRGTLNVNVLKAIENEISGGNP